jgi:CW-type Zinc Finger
MHLLTKHNLYRYGQTKPVFCYSLLTQGTTEEKVYGRCVNKTGVAFRVIDKKTIERCFTQSELEDLLQNLIWVMCAKCEKWRVLVNESSEENVPEEWDCSMNDNDQFNNSCKASEKSQQWYEKKYFSFNPGSSPSKLDSEPSSQNSNGVNTSVPSSQNSHGKSTKNDSQQQPYGSPNGKNRDASPKGKNAARAALVGCDDLLGHLLDVTAIDKNQKIICDYYFHDTIMETKQSSDEMEKVRRKLSMTKEKDNLQA